MGTKQFRCLQDFHRWGFAIQLTCGNGPCGHGGVVDAWLECRYFSLHRWSTGLESFAGRSALDHFRCRECGHRAGRASPTETAPTVTDFFPADDRGWRMLTRRLRS